MKALHIPSFNMCKTLDCLNIHTLSLRRGEPDQWTAIIIDQINLNWFNFQWAFWLLLRKEVRFPSKSSLNCQTDRYPNLMTNTVN